MNQKILYKYLKYFKSLKHLKNRFKTFAFHIFLLVLQDLFLIVIFTFYI